MLAIRTPPWVIPRQRIQKLFPPPMAPGPPHRGATALRTSFRHRLNSSWGVRHHGDATACVRPAPAAPTIWWAAGFDDSHHHTTPMPSTRHKNTRFTNPTNFRECPNLPATPSRPPPPCIASANEPPAATDSVPETASDASTGTPPAARSPRPVPPPAPPSAQSLPPPGSPATAPCSVRR